MDEQELLKERFKSAISSAVRAISENFDLEIKFGNSVTSKKNSLNLPEVVNLKNLQDFINLRAFADSEALKIKYNNSHVTTNIKPTYYDFSFIQRKKNFEAPTNRLKIVFKNFFVTSDDVGDFFTASSYPDGSEKLIPRTLYPSQ